jgi:VWFA-related protein
MPHFPPGIFSNFAPTPVASSVNILLLDALNTPMQDQMYVRNQLLNYVQHEPAGTRVAIFGLGSRLRMLQGFTSDPEVLKAAVLRQNGQASPLLTDNVGGGASQTDVNQASNLGLGLPPDVEANLQLLASQITTAQVSNRVTITLEAMNELGRYLANIPGRKNLIWFSGSFPLDLLPAGSGSSAFSTDPFSTLTSFEIEYRETTNLLARSQVAVYPVDARGIQVSPVFSVANSQSKFQQDDRQFAANLAQEHQTMERMAEDTGGHAFINTNALDKAVAQAITLGSNYYTLAYTPSDSRWNGNFRKIQVKLADKSLKLSYRHGYFADDPNSPRSAFIAGAAPNGASAPNPLQGAMEHGAPAPTEILFKVRVVPASSEAEDEIVKGNRANLIKMKGPFRRYSIDFGAVPGNLLYPADEKGNRQLSVEFVAVLYTPDGTLVNTVAESAHASLTPAGFAALQKSSISTHQEISVPARGDFYLRLAIRDLNSGRIGATEIPIAAVRNLPPLPAAAAAQPARAAPGAPK